MNKQQRNIEQSKRKREARAQHIDRTHIMSNSNSFTHKIRRYLCVKLLSLALDIAPNKSFKKNLSSFLLRHITEIE